MPERMLIRLARLNKTLAFLATAVVVFLGLLLPGIVGAAVLVVLAAGLAWVQYMTWRVTPAPVRVPRLLILALVVAAAIYKAS
ncbi:DUF6703 family protein [Dactylosporangium sp. NPDC051485]|uniref:DUF6703 family protein n=1 Tax=Dactylosporangium sp. NPDC051485 TaxID=3154846 RepID=UPI00344634DF